MEKKAKMNHKINDYITKRYPRWLDYSEYHCSCAGIGDEAIDVLNEVLCDLLQKPEEKLLSLLEKKSGQYTELDYFVLRMIKLNATSPTSPYRHQYKSLPVDGNINYTMLDIEDEEYSDHDRPGEILEKTQKIRIILDELNLSDKAMRIFCFRFFEGERFCDWPGSENEKELFDAYYKVVGLIKEKLNNKTLF